MTKSFLFCDIDHLNTVAKKALNGPLKNTDAHAALLRLTASNAKHSGIQLERSLRVQFLSGTRREKARLAHDHKRDFDRYETAESKRQHDELTGEIAEIDAELAAIRSAPQIASLPVETAIEWMGEQNGKFVNAPQVKVSAPKGLSVAVDEERAAQAEIRGRIAETNKRPLPQAEAEAQMKDDILRMALPLEVAPTTRLQQRLPGLAMSTVERPKKQGNIVFPTRREIFEGGRAGELDEAFRFMCWLLPDAILAKGKAELAAHYKATGPGLSVAERERTIAGLKAELLESERREETLIRAAEDRGEIIWRRPNASPEAVLGVMRKV